MLDRKRNLVGGARAGAEVRRVLMGHHDREKGALWEGTCQ